MLPSIPMDQALVQAGEQGQHLCSSVGVAPAGAALALRQLATSVMLVPFTWLLDMWCLSPHGFFIVTLAFRAALKLEPRDN